MRLHRKRREVSRWTDEHRAALIGWDWFNVFARGMGPFTDHPGLAVPYRIRDDHQARIDERKREAWEDLRDELLEIWIADKPFSRPHSWWSYDAPELRRCTSGTHPWQLPEFIAYCAEHEREHPGFTARIMTPHCGKPNILACPGMTRDDTYESERDYLIRLALLTEHERQLLAAETTPAAARPTANGTT
jgi:hypothetical protein